MNKIVITGGGTGGHVFPALALGQEFRRRGFEVIFVGTSSGMESRIIPANGFRLETIRSGAVKNQKLLKILASLWQLFRSILQAISFLKREQPKAVIGVGGYISFPTSFAAYLIRIPLFIQEQNISVGIANRWLGKFARRVYLGFEAARGYFPVERCKTTGNPLRSIFTDEPIPPYDPGGKHLIVMGGSQGARVLNEAIVSLLPRFQKEYPSIRVLHQTGQSDYERIRAAYKSFRGTAEVMPFVENMVNAYGRASLVICRSGALTLSELILVGRPAVLVPYPRKGQNDQTANANFLKEKGCAEVVEQGDNFQERLWQTFVLTFKSERLKQMSEAYGPLRVENPTHAIVDDISSQL